MRKKHLILLLLILLTTVLISSCDGKKTLQTVPTEERPQPSSSAPAFSTVLSESSFDESTQPSTESPSVILHTVTFLDAEGAVWASTEVERGESASLPPPPVLEGAEFLGWDQPLSEVTDDLTVSPIYQKKSYTVTFLSDSTTLSTQTVLHGEDATAPEAPVKDGAIFDGWSMTFEEITGDRTVEALWRAPRTVSVTLELGQDVFRSKDALFQSFFGEYYAFILAQGGKERLEENGVYDLDDFYRLASEPEWTVEGETYTKLYGLGTVASRWFLKQKRGGKIEDQPVDHFVGYCYQNGRYLDFLEFYMQFFAWWRKDEGYTTAENHGSDFFIEAWASTVDLGKFFYHDRSNSPVQSKRILDCFENIASVVDCPEVLTLTEGAEATTLPSALKRRGYIFLGWYTAEGEKVETVTADAQAEDICYYARWEKSAQ